MFFSRAARDRRSNTWDGCGRRGGVLHLGNRSSFVRGFIEAELDVPQASNLARILIASSR